MKYLGRLGTFVLRALRRAASLLVTRFDLVEVRILAAGLALTALLGLLLAFLLFQEPRLYTTLVATAVLHLMGGRALGVATCLSAGMSVPITVAYNFYLEVAIVLVAYGVVVLIMRNVVEPRLLKAQVRQAELAAQRQRSRVKRYGAVGLFLFVMFPFAMTGPVVGAIIGYLLHYRPASNFAIVFSGTLASITVYSLVGRNLLELLNRHVALDRVQLWGGIGVGALILVFVLYHFRTVKRLLDSSSED